MEAREKKVSTFASIRTKLLLSFFVVIGALLLQIAYLGYIHFSMIAQYREVTDNLILENKFSDYVPQFTQSYYNLINSPNNKERLNTYTQIHAEIEHAFLKLDKSIVNQDSKVGYRGLKNYVTNIMDLADKGVEDIKAGQLVESVDKYEEMALKMRFLDEISTNLIITELFHAEKLQKRIEQTHTRAVNTGLVLFILISLGCVAFSLFFAKRITDPITNLSETANHIAQGNLDLNVDKKLLEKKDEIGALSNSLSIMLNRLHSDIKSQKTISKDLIQSREHIKSKNQELEKFNKMIVGRELKMIELKKKIKELEDKLSE